MKVKLNLGQRIIILNALEKKGTYLVLRSVQRLVKDLSVKPEEEKEYEVKAENGTVRWNEKGLEEKEFTLQDAGVDLIKKTFRDLDEKGSLDMDTLPIYEKFCVPGTVPEKKPSKGARKI